MCIRFYCYFCTKTRDIDSNSQQNVEIDRVAKSLPHFTLSSELLANKVVIKIFQNYRKSL